MDLTEQEYEFIKTYRELTPEYRKSFGQYIKTLAITGSVDEAIKSISDERIQEEVRRAQQKLEKGDMNET